MRASSNGCYMKRFNVSYTHWLISVHRLILVRWGQLFVGVMIASLAHPLGARYWVPTAVFILASLDVSLISSTCPALPSPTAASPCKKVGEPQKPCQCSDVMHVSYAECGLGVPGRLPTGRPYVGPVLEWLFVSLLCIIDFTCLNEHES